MEIILVLLPLVFISGGRGESDDDADLPDSCLPRLADRCFRKLMPNLECQMDNGGSCSQLRDFCSLAKESLQCAADIIESDCKDGLANFESWLRGLQAVTKRICENNAQLLREVTENPCFNIEDFVECVEERTGIAHVIDLLHGSLNLSECNRLLIELPTCNVRAHPAQSTCHRPQTAINDVFYTFFSHTDCGVCRHQTSQGVSLSNSNQTSQGDSLSNSPQTNQGVSLSNRSLCLLFFTIFFTLTKVSSIK